MAFNFGAFAGGLATGIQKQQELALKQKQLEDEALYKQQVMQEKQQANMLKMQELGQKRYKEALEQQRKALEAESERNQTFIENVKDYGGEAAIDTYNKNSMDNKKIDINGYVYDFNEAETDKMIAIKASINSGEKKYKIDTNTGGLSVINDDGTYTPMGVRGVSVGASIEEAKLRGKDKEGITKPQMSLFLAKMDEKRASGEELTTLEQAKVKRFSTYLSTEGDVKRSASEKGLSILNKYEDSNNIGEISSDDIVTVQKADRAANIKLGDTTKTKINDAEKTLSALDKLNTFVENLKPEEIERGMFDNIKNKAKTLLSDKSFEDLSENEKKATLLTVTANTKIGSALADYIKSISGTAVAQAEYDRLMKVLTGGDASNIQTLQTSIGTFYEDKKSAYIEDLRNNLYEYGAYGLNKQRNYAKKYGAAKPKEEVKEKDELDSILGF